MAGARSAAASLTGRFRQHLEETRLVSGGGAVAIALSGGLDSVTLLHLLRFPLADLGLRLSAVHVDHGTRPDSAADAAWVRGLCRAWDVPLRVERLGEPPRSEAAARRARYRALLARAPDGAQIATAHHRDDQAETVLFRIARGTGLRGLRGIAPRRGRVVRPLLPFGRTELAAYAADAGLAWRDDPTNRELRFQRNRIRRLVLPALEEARPGAAARLAALARDARREEAAWEDALARLEREVVVEESRAGVTLAHPLLQSYHPHLRTRMVRRVLRRLGITPGRAGTRAALEFINSGSSGGELHLPGGVRLERDFDRVRLMRAPSTMAPERDEPLEIRDGGPGSGRARLGGRGWRVTWRVAESAGAAPAGRSGDEAQSARPVERAVVTSPAFPLRLRRWEPGDRIRLGYGRKKLKKLLAEHRLDRRARQSVPVLVDADGRVLWVVGLARAEGVSGTGVGLEIAVADAG